MMQQSDAGPHCRHRDQHRSLKNPPQSHLLHSHLRRILCYLTLITFIALPFTLTYRIRAEDNRLRWSHGGEASSISVDGVTANADTIMIPSHSSQSSSSSTSSHSSFFPSLHHQRYAFIHLHASPIDTNSERDDEENEGSHRRHSVLTTLSASSHHRSSSPTSHPSPLSSLPHTFPHLTFIIRTKAPSTPGMHARLNAYLHPYRLGRPMPHHAYLVTVGMPSQLHRATTGNNANGNDATVLERFQTHSAHRGHPLMHLYAHHPSVLTSTRAADRSDSDKDNGFFSFLYSSSSNAEPEYGMDADAAERAVVDWLSHAPDVVSVHRYEPVHKLHPKIQSSLQRAQRRKRMQQLLRHRAGRRKMHTLAAMHETISQDGVRSAADSWSDGTTAPSVRTHRFFLSPLHFTPINHTSDSSDGADGPSSSSLRFSSTRACPIVKLRVHLHPHPLLNHSHASEMRSFARAHDLARSEKERASHLHEHEQWARQSRRSEQHRLDVLNAWAEMLASIQLPDTDDLEDQGWIGQAYREKDRTTLRVTTSIYRAHNARHAVMYDSASKSSAVTSPSPSSSSHAATAASAQSYEQWIEELLSSPFSIHLTLITPDLINVHMCGWYTSSMIDFLSSRHEVAFIDAPMRRRRGRGHFENQNKYVHAIVQTDRNNDTRIWDAGLRGENQIIQLGDTGIDADSCFFSDPQHPLPVNAISLSHRKFVIYKTVENADVGDDLDGHGTHVAGSLAGSMDLTAQQSSSASSSLKEIASFSGMASLSKFAFYDFKLFGVEDLLVPESVYKNYLGDAYALGARISSNSWGSPDGEYSSYCIELDTFVWDSPDMLILFAAGNYGENGDETISSPGVAKNILTVGSTRTSAESYYDAGVDVGIEVVEGPAELLGKHQVVQAEFGMRFTELQLKPNASVIAADPIDACQPLVTPSVASPCDGCILLVKRGTCFFSDKALRALDVGAKLMIVVNNEPGPATHMSIDEQDTEILAKLCNIASVMIRKSIGESLINHVTHPKLNSTDTHPDILIRAPVEVDPPDSNESILSSFSSRGPTFGGRLKPDVVAPGEFVRSVRSDGSMSSTNTCPTDVQRALMQLEGTSMSTPSVSGGTALLREYFLKGFYPSGRPTAKDSFTPSAALLKAMLIHSTISAGGTIVTKRETDTTARVEQVKPAPSYHQGFGRVLLEHVMIFSHEFENSNDNDTSTRPDEPVLPTVHIEDKRSLHSDEIHSYCFSVSRSPPVHVDSGAASSNPSWSSNASHTAPPFFRATLTWMDAPVAPGAAFVLVNNLDLFVTAPEMAESEDGSRTLKGAFLPTLPGFDDARGHHDVWDIENNVEQVSLTQNQIQPVDEDGSPTKDGPIYIAVHVRGTHVATEVPQPYALVVSGWFNATRSIDDTDTIIHTEPLSRCRLPSSSSASGSEIDLLCPAGCHESDGHGSCDFQTGLCQCEGEWTGDDCSQLSVALSYKSRFSWSSDPISVPSEGWSFFSFSLSDVLSPAIPLTADKSQLSSYLSSALSSSASAGLEVSMLRLSDVGDPDLYLSLDPAIFPSRRNHDLAATGCDACPVKDPKTQLRDGKRVSIIQLTMQQLQDAITNSMNIDVNSTSSPSTPTSLGRIRLGIHGYCCDDSVASIQVRPINDASRTRYIIPVVVVLLAVALLACVCIMYSRYRRRSAAQFATHRAHMQGQGVSMATLPTARPVGPTATHYVQGTPIPPNPPSNANADAGTSNVKPPSRFSISKSSRLLRLANNTSSGPSHTSNGKHSSSGGIRTKSSSGARRFMRLPSEEVDLESAHSDPEVDGRLERGRGAEIAAARAPPQPHAPDDPEEIHLQHADDEMIMTHEDEMAQEL